MKNETHSRFFERNLSRGGRIARAIMALVLLVGAFLAWSQVPWLAALLFISSAFVFFEAARGWCLLRACGIKTKL
jgi:hypothetical protein